MPEPISQTGSATQQPAAAKSSGAVVPHSATLGQRLGASLVFYLLRGVASTLRYRWTDVSGFFDHPPAPPAIYCVWHNRLPLCLKAYYGYVKKNNRTPGMAAMVSASKDGGFLAEVLRCFGVQPVRGSTSRRGRQALLELTTWAKRGYDLAITPDGPRGPCYVVQEGVVALAQVTSLPIMPVSYSLEWKIRTNSWDRFQIPLPFSRCEIIYARPVRVPRDATDADRASLRQHLEAVLRSISRD